VTGHRTRFRAHKDWFVSEMQEALGSSVHDVQLILDYLTQRGDLDMSRVAMFGSGSGGAIAVLASAADPRIKVVDLLAPWGGWPTWLAETKVIPDDERANYLKPEFMAKVAPLDPVDWFPKIKAKRVRILDIRSNKAMPNKSQEMLEAAAPDVAIINQYGNGRAFFGAQPGMTLFDWMKEQLKTDSKPQIAQEKSERIHFYPAVEAPAEPKRLNPDVSAKPEKPQATGEQKPQ
jgi:dienelactone hydrolase